MPHGDWRHILIEAVHNGYGRFEGRYNARMSKTGFFQCPEDWTSFLSLDDVCMTFDQITGEILVYYEDDEPDIDALESQSWKDELELIELGIKLPDDSLLPYVYTYFFRHFNESGRACIEPFVVRGVYTIPVLDNELDIEQHPFYRNLERRVRYVSSSEAKIADESIDIVMEGRGHYFTIAKADGGWALDQSNPDWKRGFRFLQYYSVYNLLKAVREPRELSAYQRKLLTSHPSNLEQNQTGPQPDVS